LQVSHLIAKRVVRIVVHLIGLAGISVDKGERCLKHISDRCIGLGCGIQQRGNDRQHRAATTDSAVDPSVLVRILTVCPGTFGLRPFLSLVFCFPDLPVTTESIATDLAPWQASQAEAAGRDSGVLAPRAAW
jgi:hypothetical protein